LKKKEKQSKLPENLPPSRPRRTDGEKRKERKENATITQKKKRKG